MAGAMILMTANNFQNVRAAYYDTTNPEKVTVKIIKTNKKYIKIKLVNKGNVRFYYWGGFILKKVNGKKWKKVKLRITKFPKTVSLEAHGTKIVKIKWKKYYGEYLPKGKYKIKVVKERKFYIK